MPLVTPAMESDRGRGAPVFDVWNSADGRLLSYKISNEARNPRNLVVTTGTLNKRVEVEAREWNVYTTDENGKPVMTDEKVEIPASVEILPGHIAGVIRGIRGGAVLPMVGYNQTKDGQWYRVEIDVAEVLRKHDPVPTKAAAEQFNLPRPEGRSFPVSLSVARRVSGGRYLYYVSLRMNIAPLVKLGLCKGWEPVESPELPA